MANAGRAASARSFPPHCLSLKTASTFCVKDHSSGGDHSSNSGKGTKSNGVKGVVRRVPRRRPDVYDFTCKEKLHRHEHNWRIFGRKPNKDRKGVERIYYKCTREKCRARIKIDLDMSRGRQIHFEMYTKVR